MKPLLSFLFTFFVLINGIISQQTINGVLQHEGLTREYILYIPASYNAEESTPLLFSFHGYTSNAQTNLYYTNFKSIADTAGFILIHPQGSLLNGITHWNVGGWTIGSTVDDVSFVSELMDTISKAYNIDSDRMYSTGMSNGGYMSFLLACKLSDRIAAIASVTGSMTPQSYNTCQPSHPTPIMQIHGTSDGTVPYNGNFLWTKSIDDVIEYWVEYNNTSSEPIIIEIPDINTSDGSTVEHYIYGDGDNSTAVEHFKVIGGDHDWPGVWGNMDIDASKEVWNFLSKYDINGLIESQPNAITDNNNSFYDQVSIFPNPATTTIKVSNNINKNIDYQIYTPQGQMIKSGSLDSNNREIDITNLKPNLYFFNVGNKTFKIIKVNY
jgi:polyhydroxybutyrate depolymerase